MKIPLILILAGIGLGVVWGGNSLQAAEESKEESQADKPQVEKTLPVCPFCGAPLSEESSKKLEELRADREKLRQEMQKFREKWGKTPPFWGRAFLSEEAAKKLEELRAKREELRQEMQKLREKWGFYPMPGRRGGVFPWRPFGKGCWEWRPPLRGFHGMPW